MGSAPQELTARSLDADREKRQALERAKAEELGKARSELTQWQQRVGGDGDGNDTESEDEDFQSLLKEPEAMPDHPDYHGRGWRASDAPARAAGTSQRKQQALGGDASALGNGHALGDEERGAAIWAEGDEENEAPAPVGKKEEIEVEREEEAAPVVVRPLPPPRRQVSEAVRIAFTPTEIAHMPAREKREVELKCVAEPLLPHLCSLRLLYVYTYFLPWPLRIDFLYIYILLSNKRTMK